MVIGFLRPAILVPYTLLERLTSTELDHIVLHEWAHIRRRDHWSNFALELAKALFFFHPAVWWIARRLQLEREIACDDAVVAATSEPAAYAACLARLMELNAGPAVFWSPAALGDGRELFHRVERLIHWRGCVRFSPLRFAGAAAGLLAATVCIARIPALVDIPAPVLSLAAPHPDLDGARQLLLAEVQMRSATIFMEAAERRMVSAQRLMRAAKEQMRLARLASTDDSLPLSRVVCRQPSIPPPGLRLNRI